MNLNYFNILLSIIIISILSSCSRDIKKLPLLLKIDTIILSNPDSAYNLLSSIKNIELQNAEEKALFALLLTQAKDKNNIPHKNDSLISIAVNYYKHTTKDKMKAKAYFYLGRVLQENNNISEAVFAYLKASNRNSDDYKIQVLTYDNLAACYESQNFFHKALEAYQHSYLLNKENKDSIGMLYSLRSIANLYVLQEEDSKAVNYYNQALSIIKQVDDSTLKSAIYCDISRFHYDMGNSKIANKYIDMAILNTPNSLNVPINFF